MNQSTELKEVLYFRDVNRVRKKKIPLLVATEVPSKEHPGETKAVFVRVGEAGARNLAHGPVGPKGVWAWRLGT